MPISHEFLETLLIDRAMDAMTPEGEALLSAYLEKDPEAAALAREIEETVVLARAVLKPVKPDALPPLRPLNVVPMPMPVPAGGDERRQTCFWRPALAACAAAGFLLGALFGRTQSPSGGGAGTAQLARAVIESQTASPEGVSSSSVSVQRPFWSRGSMLASHSSESGPAAGVRWDSPMRRPRNLN